MKLQSIYLKMNNNNIKLNIMFMNQNQKNFGIKYI